MRFLLTGLRYLVAGVGALALLVTLVSVVPATVWWAQALGFARLQLLGVLAVGCACRGAGRHVFCRAPYPPIPPTSTPMA